MAEPQGDFIWYELMTDDVEAAGRFYGDVIGWRFASDNSAPPGTVDYRMIERSDGRMAGGVLALTPEMKEGGARPGWFGYIHTTDVDGAARRFVDAGGTMFIEPHDMPGVGRIAFLSDPQGAPIYMMKPQPPSGDPDAQSDVFSVDQPQRCRWNQLMTTDTGAALALYREVFGWGQEGGMPMGEVGDYLFLQNGDVTFGALMPKMDDVPAPVWSYFFGVDDIDRAAKAVEAGGGRLDTPVQEIPGGEFSVHCFDPQGAGFGLVGPRKE